MVADPNMRCVCGYRRFREQRPVITSAVEQWVLFDNASYGGFGSTPFGTYFGSGPAGLWGLFGVDVALTHKQVVCENCQRVRSDNVIGGAGVFGSYLFADSIFVLVTDISVLGCMRVRFASADLGITVDVSPTLYDGPPLPLAAPAPVTTAPTPPTGATVASVLRAVLPDVDHDGTFVVSLVDACSGSTTPLTTIILESTVQIHTPEQADLNGLPRQVITKNFRTDNPVAQPGTGAISSIPFDKCDYVIEYDARFGQLPGAAGFTEGGSGGTFALVDGGVLSITTTAMDFFYKEVTLGAAATEVHLYAMGRCDASATTTESRGFRLLVDGAPGALGDYSGVQMRLRPNQIASLALDGATAGVLPGFDPPGSSWLNFYVARRFSDTKHPGAIVESFFGQFSSSSWGSGDPGGVSPTFRMGFGDFEGSNLQAYLRNMVASLNGRFMRAFFRSYAAVAAPTLRLYFTADTDAGPGKTARIRVRYGTLGLGANPYSLATASVTDITTSFTTKNQVVEVPLSLNSMALMPKAPFWFSVERDWSHTDDTMPGTAHLLSATVRAS